MTANELGVQVGSNIGDGEVARFGGHLRVKEHLQQQIAQFILQVGPGAALDRVEDLVGLLQRVSLDGVEGLLAVPGTAVRAAQTRHDSDRFSHSIRAGGDGCIELRILRRGSCHSFNFTRFRRSFPVAQAMRYALQHMDA